MNNDPLVVCEKEYYVDGKPSGTLYRCVKVDTGWQCPHCKTVYEHKNFKGI